MAARYPFLMFVMRVCHEDDDSYPTGYFKVSPAVPTAVIPPPLSRQASDESEIATRVHNMTV